MVFARLLRKILAEPPETVFEKFDMVRLEREIVESDEEVPATVPEEPMFKRYEYILTVRAVIDSSVQLSMMKLAKLVIWEPDSTYTPRA